MDEKKKRTKVYVIDDSLTFRAMMDTLVGQDEDLEICGMAADAEAALDDIDWLQPDIILLDETLPGMDSLVFLDELKTRWHGTHVVMISVAGSDGINICKMALDKGAVACFDKSRLIRNSREFIPLMDEIRDGEIHPDWHQGKAVTLGASPA